MKAEDIATEKLKQLLQEVSHRMNFLGKIPPVPPLEELRQYPPPLTQIYTQVRALQRLMAQNNKISPTAENRSASAIRSPENRPSPFSKWGG